MTRAKPAVLCTATKTNGEPCQRAPIRGGSVCPAHGGSAPHVIKAARVRLAMASKNAVDVLVAILEDTSVAERDRINAAKEILTRSGISGTQSIELDVNVRWFEDTIDALYVDIEEDDDNFSISPGEVVFDADGKMADRQKALDAATEEREAQRAASKRRGGSGALSPTVERSQEARRVQASRASRKKYPDRNA